MKVLHSIFTLIVVVVAFAAGEVPMSKRSLLPHNWPAKNSNQLSMARNPGGKPRTLVVQIRSDQPVPLVFKGRPAAHANGHLTHLHHHHAGSLHHYARPLHARPLKLSAPSYHLKAASMLSKPLQFRKPLKLKLANSKLKAAKLTYEKPFQYKLPTTTAATVFADVKQQLPLETHAHFISDHFAPIHTIPAPNLAPLHDNHIHHEVEVQHHPNSHYQVTEDSTNDHTIFDPHSGVQKLYAPDPDPALPAGKVRVALESYNQPSNGQPLPADVQSNYLPPVAQPLVQIVGAQAQPPQQPAPEIYPIQFAQPQPVQLQSLSPTYLISQSNNLYTQHQQQLFKPAAAVQAAGYVNADLTQEVASNGQILQAAKDPHNNIHPVLDTAPQFAALIAAPALGEDHHQQPVSLRLPNAGAAAAAPESGFVVSNFFGNAQDSSQLLQSYAEEERQQQQLEAEKHYQQLQHEQREQQLLLQQQQNHLIELQQQQQQQEQLQQQQQLYTQQLQQQQLQQQLQQLQQAQHPQQQQLIQPRQQQPVDSSVPGAFEGHQFNNHPLRIFVPDDESEAIRIKKRADNMEKTTTEDSPANDKSLN